MKLYQMDVKSAFLNGTISKEVYVSQPPGFENDLLSSHVFKLKKALYGLKQVPRAWYEKLSSFLTNNNFIRGKTDNTLFRKEIKDDFIIVQIYVDDIIFGATNENLCQEFSKLMQDEFEMSMGRTEVLSRTSNCPVKRRNQNLSDEIYKRITTKV
uniref:Retrovirus-related Pol polyprotein from transposon TNT 1-94 n=1 Tax=Cajanus cajan TaxID=3821 RepID=A0A151SRF5_CAJCA|nr:Retrovirus-related Pol polyprotein from transposon TNT 1-94 [Cajanus cajan]